MSSSGKVVFRFSKAADYRVASVTGVYGGLTPSRQIIANLFIDFPPLPDTATHELTAEGRLGDEIDRTGCEADGILIDRRLEVGVIINAENARDLAKWLNDQADALDEPGLAKGGEDVPDGH